MTTYGQIAFPEGSTDLYFHLYYFINFSSFSFSTFFKTFCVAGLVRRKWQCERKSFLNRAPAVPSAGEVRVYLGDSKEGLQLAGRRDQMSFESLEISVCVASLGLCIEILGRTAMSLVLETPLTACFLPKRVPFIPPHLLSPHVAVWYQIV